MGLCLRFADDFETSLDDWKPDATDSSIMNLCMVSEGTYEVCSRTIAQKPDKSGNNNKCNSMLISCNEQMIHSNDLQIMLSGS